MTDYEIVDPALSGNPTTCEYRAWQWNPNISNYGPDTTNCSIVYWTDSAVAERAGPHERRSLRVRRAAVQRQHRHVLQLADESERGRTARSSRDRAWCSTRSNCANTPVFERLQRSRERTPTCRSRPRTPRSARRPTARVGGTGCLYTGPTTIVLHNSGNAGLMDVTSPGDEVDQLRVADRAPT